MIYLIYQVSEKPHISHIWNLQVWDTHLNIVPTRTITSIYQKTQRNIKLIGEISYLGGINCICNTFHGGTLIEFDSPVSENRPTMNNHW